MDGGSPNQCCANSDRNSFFRSLLGLSFGGLHLGDVDVEVADGIGPEGLPGWLVTLDVRQPGDAVTPQATMIQKTNTGCWATKNRLKDKAMRERERILGIFLAMCIMRSPLASS